MIVNKFIIVLCLVFILLLLNKLIRHQEYFQDSNQDFNLSKYYSDNFIFHSYPAGNKKGVKTSKIDYLDNLQKMKSMGYVLNVVHSIYLPGIQEKTYEVDGSVRVYYGAILSIDTNMVEFSAYMTVNFIDNQIAEVWEWADYGGIDNRIKELHKTID